VDEKETTVYKRALDVGYQLKMKASRWGGREGERRPPSQQRAPGARAAEAPNSAAALACWGQASP
jgi:hypothetical protein